MSMRPGLFTVEALSVELARDRRTIARHLRDVPPDGSDNGRPAWRMATAVRALSDGTRRAPQSRADLDALEVVAERVEDLLDQLHQEPDVERRRQLLASGAGKAVGDLAHAFEQCQRTAEPDFRIIAQPFVDQTVGRVVATVLHLCHWRIDPQA